MLKRNVPFFFHCLTTALPYGRAYVLRSGLPPRKRNGSADRSPVRPVSRRGDCACERGGRGRRRGGRRSCAACCGWRRRWRTTSVPRSAPTSPSPKPNPTSTRYILIYLSSVVYDLLCADYIYYYYTQYIRSVLNLYSYISIN